MNKREAVAASVPEVWVRRLGGNINPISDRLIADLLSEPPPYHDIDHDAHARLCAIECLIDLGDRFIARAKVSIELLKQAQSLGYQTSNAVFYAAIKRGFEKGVNY